MVIDKYNDLLPLILFVIVLMVLVTMKSIVHIGLRAIIQLRFIIPVLIFCQYLLSPLIIALKGVYYYDFILVDSLLNVMSTFVSFSIIMFYFGYGPGLTLGNLAYTAFSKNKYKIISIASIILLNVVLMLTMGIENYIDSPFARGSRQFDASQIERVLGSLVSMYSFLVIVFVPLVWINSSFLSKCIVSILASLPFMVQFSRVSGVVFFIFSFYLLLGRVKTPLWQFIVLIILGIHFSLAGLNGRSKYKPGIVNYVKSSLDFNSKSDDVVDTDIPFLNPLDAHASFTRKASLRDDDDTPAIHLIMNLSYNILPLPSSFGLKRVGVDLTDALGTTGNVGITTPALAELYYVFGFFGVFFAAFLGIFAKQIDKSMNSFQTNYLVAAYLMLLLAIGISGHSWLRAMSRPMYIAIILYVLHHRRFLFIRF